MSEQHVRAGRIGAHVTHATHDSRTITAPARRAFLAKFEAQVDPDGELDPIERSKRAQHAMTAHMQRLALKSAAKRKAKNDTSRRGLSGGSVNTSDGVNTVAARAS